MPAHEHGPKTQEPPVRRIAAPLVVGAADDRAEIEADLVADRVIARLQSGDTGEVEAPEQHVHNGCHGVARQAAPSVGAPEVGYDGGAISDHLTARIEGARGSGRALDSGVRQRLEPAFGGSLADVRVHTGSEASQLNRAVSARAFTTGNDIFFGSGEYSPSTPGGERMLAHEIAHTRQQGGGARRVHRAWDVKSRKFDLNDGYEISTLDTRPIWFVTGDEGKVVIKQEDQPIGLGDLAAKMHKKVSKLGSVDQRVLNTANRKDLKSLLDTRSYSEDFKAPKNGWTKRGQVLQVSDASLATDEPTEVAKNDAMARLDDTGKTMIAMSLAEGKDAQDLSQADTTVPDDDNRTRFRQLMMDPKHLEVLGRMTAIDLFFGNQDRVLTGNLGNWFINPQSEITLIDSIDPGNGDRLSASDSYTVPNTWERKGHNKRSPGAMFTRKNRGLAIADLLVQGALQSGWDKKTDTGGDGTVRAWAKATHANGAQSRREFMSEHLENGFAAGTRSILRVFSSTKWKLKGGSHSAKKAIRSSAKAAAVTDGRGKDAYYAELKRRAQWIRTNGT